MDLCNGEKYYRAKKCQLVNKLTSEYSHRRRGPVIQDDLKHDFLRVKITESVNALLSASCLVFGESQKPESLQQIELRKVIVRVQKMRSGTTLKEV